MESRQTVIMADQISSSEVRFLLITTIGYDNILCMNSVTEIGEHGNSAFQTNIIEFIASSEMIKTHPQFNCII